MKKKLLTTRRMVIRNFHRLHVDFLLLYGIYRDTIDPEISFETFCQLYCSESLVYIDFSFYSHHDVRAGFSAAFFYTACLQGKKVFIARTATGLVERFQGAGYHDIVDLYIKFMKFALIHPLTPLYITAFVINPFVYKELCEFVPQFYPRPWKPVPAGMDSMMNEIMTSTGHSFPKEKSYAVKVPIQVNLNESLLKRISKCKNKNVLWFLKQVEILDKVGLLVVVKVSLPNIIGTISNLSRWHLSKKKDRLMIHARRLKIS